MGIHWNWTKYKKVQLEIKDKAKQTKNNNFFEQIYKIDDVMAMAAAI